MIKVFVSKGGKVTAVHADTAEKVSIFYENEIGDIIVENDCGVYYRAARDNNIDRAVSTAVPPEGGLYPKAYTWRDTFVEWVKRNIPRVVRDVPESSSFLNKYEDNVVEVLLISEYAELKLVREILDEWNDFITMES